MHGNTTCDPRYATAWAYVCNNPPHASYQQSYAYTPGFLSAPQQIGVPDNEQTLLLSPLDRIAWGLNSLRFNPHN